MKTKYLMYKDGMAVNIDEVSSISTTERNGVEVYVEPSLDYGYNAIKDAIKELIFFENLYINLNIQSSASNYGYYSSSYLSDLKAYVDKFNKRKNKVYNNFYVSSIDTVDSFSVVLGTVLYRVDSSHSSAWRDKWRNNCYDYRLFPKFEIGELSVTPNREELLYDAKTEKALEEKFKKVEEELVDIYSKKYSGDQNYTIVSAFSGDFILQFDDEDEYMNVKKSNDFVKKIIEKHSTIYGEKLSSAEIDNLEYLCTHVYPFYTTHAYDGRIVKVREYERTVIDVSTKRYEYGRKDSVYFRKEFRAFNSYMKCWMKENYSRFVILDYYPTRHIIEDFRHRDYNGVYKSVSRKIKKIYYKIVKDLWKSLTPIDESIVTQEYKAKFKITPSAIPSGNINVTIVNDDSVQQIKMRVSEFINSTDSHINIYASESESLLLGPLSKISDAIIAKNFDSDFTVKKSIRFVKVSEKVKKLAEGKPGMIHYSELLKPDKYWIRFIVTMERILTQEWTTDVLGSITEYSYGMSEGVSKFISEFRRAYHMYSNFSNCKQFMASSLKDVKIDEDLIKKFSPSQTYINTIKVVKALKDTRPDQMARLLMASIEGVDKMPKFEEEYKNLINLCSKNDKEHNQNEQILECDAQ